MWPCPTPLLLVHALEPRLRSILFSVWTLPTMSTSLRSWHRLERMCFPIIYQFILAVLTWMKLKWLGLTCWCISYSQRIDCRRLISWFLNWGWNHANGQERGFGNFLVGSILSNQPFCLTTYLYVQLIKVSTRICG